MGQSSRKMAISWVPIPAHDRCASSLIETLQNLMAEDSYWQGQVHWTGCFFQTQSTGKYQGYHFFYHPDLMGFLIFPVIHHFVQVILGTCAVQTDACVATIDCEALVTAATLAAKSRVGGGCQELQGLDQTKIRTFRWSNFATHSHIAGFV